MTKWRHERIYDHKKKKTSRAKCQNIWHHPHVHHSPPSSNYSLIPRIPERKGTGNGNGGIGWRCIYDHQSIAVCKYTYSNSPNIETSTFSSTYDSFYLPLAQTKSTVLYIHTFPSPPLASPHPFSHSKAFTNTQPITHFPHNQLCVDKVWLRHQSSCSCTSSCKKETKNQKIRNQPCRTLHRIPHSSRHFFFADPTSHREREGGRKRVCVRRIAAHRMNANDKI